MTAVSTATFASGSTSAVVASAPRTTDGAAAQQAVPDSANATMDTLTKLATQSAGAAEGTASANTHASGNAQAALKNEVKELQARMDKLNPELAFVVDQDSGKTTIQLTDRTTKEVILQFPSEAAKQISKALDRFVKGQLVNQQA